VPALSKTVSASRLTNYCFGRPPLFGIATAPNTPAFPSATLVPLSLNPPIMLHAVWFTVLSAYWMGSPYWVAWRACANAELTQDRAGDRTCNPLSSPPLRCDSPRANATEFYPNYINIGSTRPLTIYSTPKIPSAVTPYPAYDQWTVKFDVYFKPIGTRVKSRLCTYSAFIEDPLMTKEGCDNGRETFSLYNGTAVAKRCLDSDTFCTDTLYFDYIFLHRVARC
jgi:hypothetical protein